MSSHASADRGGASPGPSESLELPVASRPRARRAFRAVTRTVFALASLVVMALALPASLGLSLATVRDDEMSGTMDRGSVVFTRARAVADLRAGDVITYPGPVDDEPITRRVVDIKAGEIWTSADRTGAVDPWTVPPGGATQARVVADLPYLGYVYDAFVDGAARLGRAFSFLD